MKDAMKKNAMRMFMLSCKYFTFLITHSEGIAREVKVQEGGLEGVQCLAGNNTELVVGQGHLLQLPDKAITEIN